MRISKFEKIDAYEQLHLTRKTLQEILHEAVVFAVIFSKVVAKMDGTL